MWSVACPRPHGFALARRTLSGWPCWAELRPHPFHHPVRRSSGQRHVRTASENNASFSWGFARNQRPHELSRPARVRSAAPRPRALRAHNSRLPLLRIARAAGGVRNWPSPLTAVSGRALHRALPSTSPSTSEHFRALLRALPSTSSSACFQPVTRPRDPGRAGPSPPPGPPPRRRWWLG